ncbi:MAG: hypothetical protein WDM89_10015 [Rhizomicrobium sp.]
MKLFLHIGTEKTGTSSVQKFFRANREALARIGILYPVTPGNHNHTGLAMAAEGLQRRGPLRKSLGLKTDEQIEEHRRKLKDGFKAELDTGSYHTVVMSGEHCSSRLLEDSEVAWLKDWLSPLFDEITIVLYIRRQDDYLLSTYSTSIKTGATHALRMPNERSMQMRYNHWDLLSRWVRVFGREHIVCRKFERAALKSGDIVDDFLDICGIDPAGYSRPQDANESLDAESLEFLRLFNAHVPRFEGGGINLSRNNIVTLLSGISNGPLITLPPEDLAAFMKLFEDSNRRVAIEYFGGARDGDGDPLFSPPSDKRARTRHAGLTVDRAVEIAAYLWQRKQEQFERVAERARSNKAAARAAGTKPGGLKPVKGKQPAESS